MTGLREKVTAYLALYERRPTARELREGREEMTAALAEEKACLMGIEGCESTGHHIHFGQRPCDEPPSACILPKGHDGKHRQIEVRYEA